ncbi:hypothetical protein KC315_g6421 [Hortaea werneckii]|nr:hypothetical protein KC315_g6421 [Hortaea werneckii]
MNNDARISVAPSDPDELLVPTSFCYYIVRYLRGAHDNGLFVSNDTAELVSRSSAESFKNLSNFHKCCITAIDLLGRKYTVQGFALISVALVLVEQTLEEQDPKLLDVLCDVSILLHTKGMGQLYEILKDKVCGMVEIIAAKKKEQHQPWAQIFALIRKLPGTQVVETMRRGWECGYDQLERLLPEHPWHALNISCSSDYPLRMGNAVQKHWNTLLTRSVRPQDGNVSDMQRHFACSKILYLQGNYSEALEGLIDLLLQCSKARQQGDMKWMTMEIDALEVSARCHYATGTLSPSDAEMSSAETKLRVAIGLSGRMLGIKSATTIALQHTLWLWLLEQGRNGEAAVWEKAMDAVLDASGRADV